SALVRAEPRAPLMFPYLAYLVILAFQDLVPSAGMQYFIVLHILATAGVCWAFRGHYPPLGRAHAVWASLIGLVACIWWVGGQHAADHWSIAGVSLGGRLPLYPGESKVYDPHVNFGLGPRFWSYAGLKTFRAVMVVPFVEELLWRGFLLRAF